MSKYNRQFVKAVERLEKYDQILTEKKRILEWQLLYECKIRGIRFPEIADKNKLWNTQNCTIECQIKKYNIVLKDVRSGIYGDPIYRDTLLKESSVVEDWMKKYYNVGLKHVIEQSKLHRDDTNFPQSPF